MNTYDGVPAAARNAHAAATPCGVCCAREGVDQLCTLVVSRIRGDVPSRGATCADVGKEGEQRIFGYGERVAANQGERYLCTWFG